jgi:hypothetical protein
VWFGLFVVVMGPVFAYYKYRKSADPSRRAKVMWLLVGVALFSLGYGCLSTGAAGVWLISLPPPSPLSPETIAATLRPAYWVDASSKVAMALAVLGFVGSGVLWLLSRRHPRSA